MRYLVKTIVIAGLAAAAVGTGTTAAGAEDRPRVRAHVHHHSHHYLSHRENGKTVAEAALGSPGVLSGNIVRIPVRIPVNVCGNTVDVIAAVNPAFGNSCVNASVRSDDHGARLHVHHRDHAKGHR